MIDLQTYKQVTMDLIINENMRLMEQIEQDNDSLYNAICSITSAMQSMYWAFVESLPDNFDTNRILKPEYKILFRNGDIICEIRYQSKWLMVEYMVHADNSHTGLIYYAQDTFIPELTGQLNGANPRADLLHWVVS